MVFYPSLKVNYESHYCRPSAKRKKDEAGKRNMSEDKAWVQFKHLLCVRYCAKRWGGGTVTPRPHKPCIVSRLTTNTSSAITMPWDDMAGAQRLFVISSGRTDAEAPSVSGEAWPPDAKSWLWIRPYAGKDWGQKEKGTTEDEMVGWHHRFNGHELGQTPVDSEREAWHAAIHGVAKNQTRLSDWKTRTGW